MSKVLIVNASPTITLAKVDRLDLLSASGSEVLLPEPVAQEILDGPCGDPARIAIESGWGQRVPVENVPSSVIEWGLGKGESAVLALAIEHGNCTAVLDDADGRRCARTLGVPVVGTLGLVLRAKQRGQIESASQIIQALQRVGLFLDDALLATVLPHVGESWPLTS